MSFAEDAVAPGHPEMPLAEVRSEMLPRLPVYAVCTLLALITNYVLGKDLAWDTLNYHLYAGFSAVNNRFAQDYFAAGPPSYFNPYAFVPFYLLVKAGLSPLMISSLLAVVHSIILWLVFELAVCVCPSDNRRTQLAFGVCVVAMTFLNPILVQQIGSSFADITTAVLVLAGWLLIARAVRIPQAAWIVYAGVLIGAATALKPTNAVHAVATFALFVFLPQTLFGRIRYALSYAAATALGFVIVAAPWSYRLEQAFGNPLFPLMNGTFRSPEFTTEPLRHFRFIPDSLAQALWRPFAMVNSTSMAQEELMTPDLRYAVLVVLAGALLAHWLWKRLAPPSDSAAPPAPAATRVLAALGCSFAVDWVLWLTASGNGRYFLPMASIAAVVIVALIFRLFDTRPKLRNYVLIVILGAQAIQLCYGAEHRWNGVSWDRHWLGIEMPEKLANEPNLYLTAGFQSNSFIAAYLAKDSGLVNISGAYVLGPDGANGTRINTLIRRYAPHLRVLWRATKSEAANLPRDYRFPVNDALAPFGLRIDSDDCARIALHGLPPELEITWQSSTPTGRVEPPKTQSDTSYLISCRIVPEEGVRSMQIDRERAVDLVFDRVEDACPELFQPRRLRTEHVRDVWRRFYVNTDIFLMSTNGSIKFKFLKLPHGESLVFLGRERDWANAPLKLACGRRDDYYFATVLDSKLKQ
jgi:Glycosyltransferase family 87